MSFEEVLFAVPSSSSHSLPSLALGPLSGQIDIDIDIDSIPLDQNQSPSQGQSPCESSAQSNQPQSPSRRSSRKPKPSKKRTVSESTDSLANNRTNNRTNSQSLNMTDIQSPQADDGDNPASAAKKTGKSRRELPAGAVATLKAWLLSPEHFTHPYPTPQDQIMLMNKTGIDKKQLKNWFTNARRRIWKPMLKKQLEQGKIQQTTSGGVVTMPGASGLLSVGAVGGVNVNVNEYGHQVHGRHGHPSGHAHPAHGISPHQQHVNVVNHAIAGIDPNSATATATATATASLQNSYQQVLQGQPQGQQSYDQYGNPTSSASAPGTATAYTTSGSTYPSQYTTSGSNTNTNSGGGGSYNPNDSGMTTGPHNNSLGSLPHMSSASNLNKTDSHAVLMELFARDQDLVRQATRDRANNLHNPNSTSSDPTATSSNANANANANASGGGGGEGGGTGSNHMMGPNNSASSSNPLGSQHPMNKIAGGSSTLNKLGNVPSMNSWPHFSSVSSLNKLGTMTGVKSITNMSGVDLASQGSLNRKGNLAQVKSIENFGRADSYAFLEVFFDNPGGSNHGNRGIKREREEDDNVGLSLDADEGGSSPAATVPRTSSVENNIKAAAGAPVAAPLPPDGQDKEGLKRAYDDALAARGLISVSRSSEKLTDLALPVKMQRTISQEYLKSMNAGTSTTFTTFAFSSVPSQNSVNSTGGGGAPSPGPGPGPGPAPLSESRHQVPPVHPAAASQSQDQTQSSSTPSPFTPSTNTTTCNRNTSNTCSATPSSALSQIPSTLNTQTNPNASDSVEVPATTKCALCGQTAVDTQLRPCGHMFHGKCLKPSIQNAVGAPQCPIDGITMNSAVLAVPTEENPPVVVSAAPNGTTSFLGVGVGVGVGVPGSNSSNSNLNRPESSGVPGI